jgi:hypothetical protein
VDHADACDDSACWDMVGTWGGGKVCVFGGGGGRA